MDTEKVAVSDIELKTRIMTTAREQFYIYGFSKVTVDEIADKLGMSKKTLYKFFPSKDELVLETVQMTIKEMDIRCQGIMNRTDLNFVDRFKGIMTDIGLQYSKMGKHMIDDLQRNFPAIWKTIADYRREKILKDFSRLLQEGMDHGIFRNDIHRDLLLLFYNSATHSIINPEVLSQIPFPAVQVFEAIVKIIFEGVLTENARKDYYAK